VSARRPRWVSPAASQPAAWQEVASLDTDLGTVRVLCRQASTWCEWRVVADNPDVLCDWHPVMSVGPWTTSEFLAFLQRIRVGRDLLWEHLTPARCRPT
jgi:hypothetical protein